MVSELFGALSCIHLLFSLYLLVPSSGGFIIYNDRPCRLNFDIKILPSRHNFSCVISSI